MNSLSMHQPHNFWTPSQTSSDYQFDLLQVEECAFRESIVKLQQCCALKVVHYRHYTLLLDSKLHIRAALCAPGLDEHDRSRETQYLLANDNDSNNVNNNANNSKWCRAPLQARVKCRFLSLSSSIRKIPRVLFQVAQLGKNIKFAMLHRTLAKKLSQLDTSADNHWHTVRLTN